MNIMQNIPQGDLAKKFMPPVLRRYRDEAGLSQQELADRVGISKSYISSLELGYRAPNLNILVRIAYVLGIAPGRLVDAMLAEAKSTGILPESYHA